ncbi:hypothetical protein [Mammaliicoccus sciuri]|uniref:hypothetical protein n=1 Tax=Mammaliicoccus sciuri TaxID=1296 RepID=UPI000E697E16|nr:hypothetical protein [Mammaliicoccus sciuri]RIN79452.1 hypothetical protein BU007_09155 [Mammaliicoccus sciuri]
MAKPTRDEVNKWAKQQNLNIDDVFNESEKQKRTVKVGDSVHVKRLKNRKVDIMREVTKVNSDYFTIKHSLSSVLELKVHYTDEYEIIPSTPFKKDYKLMYEDIKDERDQYKRERDSLIKDVKKLRGLKDQLIFENRYLEEQVKSLRNKYTNLTEHIKDKALNNPSEHRYFRLVHFIDDLEDDTHEG